VQLRGNSWLANRRYKFNELDEVVLLQGNGSDELLFRWFDHIDASCWIFRFDTKAHGNLNALIREMTNKGVKVKTEQPRK